MANPDTEKEWALEQVLMEISERLLLCPINWKATQDFFESSRNKNNFYKNIYISKETEECIGSYFDGLSIQLFDKDVDFMSVSRFALDKEDEKTFEYKEDPCYLQIPLPDKYKSLGVEPVNDKYLDSTDVFNKRSPLFSRETKVKNAKVENVKDETLIGTTCSMKQHFSKYLANTEERNKFQGARYYSWYQATFYFCFYAKHNESKLSRIYQELYGKKSTTYLEIVNVLKFLVTMMKLYTLVSTFQLSNIDSYNTPIFQENLKKASCPPKIKFSSHQPLNQATSHDFVPALFCGTWPRVAANFPIRHRHWPNKDVIKKIIEKGFHIVSKFPDVNPNDLLDFSLSFSIAEKELVNNIPKRVKQAFLILKLIFKMKVDPELRHKRVLTSYHLKTALFWILEKTEPKTWEKKTLSAILKCLTDYLLLHLDKKCIPSYFVEKQNLLRGFSDDDIKNMKNVLTRIQLFTADYLLEFTYIEQKAYLQDYPRLSDFFLINQFRSFPRYWKNENVDKNCDYFINLAREKKNKYEKINFELSKFISFLRSSNLVLKIEKAESGNDFCQEITKEQLDYATFFVSFVKYLGDDAFNFIYKTEDIHMYENVGILVPPNAKLKIPFYKENDDRNFGIEYFIHNQIECLCYARLFFGICDKLLDVNAKDIENNDAKFIVSFLSHFEQQPNILKKDKEKLLYGTLLFCRSSIIDHFQLPVEQQIVRSIRQFLQDIKHSMSIYFPLGLQIPEFEKFEINLDLKLKLRELMKDV